MLLGAGAVFFAWDPAGWLQRWAGEAHAMPAGLWTVAIGACMAVTLLIELWTGSAGRRHIVLRSE